MRSMRKLESEHITPEFQGFLKIRNGDAGVIGGNDAKSRLTHRISLTADFADYADSKDENTR